MSSQIQPLPWFNGIQYNPKFFSATSSSITLSYANSHYLLISSGSNPVSNATSTTFTNAVTTGSLIAPSLTLSGAAPILITNTMANLGIGTQASTGGVISLNPRQTTAMNIAYNYVEVVFPLYIQSSIYLPTTVVNYNLNSLGYQSPITSTAALTLASGTYRTIGAFAPLSAGVYKLNGVVSYQCTSAGTTTSMCCGFTTTPSIISVTGQFYLSTYCNSTTQTFGISVNGYWHFIPVSCVITTDGTMGNIYLITQFVGASPPVFLVSGSMSYTRIG